jgi:hypothetical protein
MLDEFCYWFNNEAHGGLYSENYPSFDQAYQRHYVEDREHSGVRASNLGKPAMITALQKLGYSEPAPKGNLLYTFMLGDVFEITAEALLLARGFEVKESQGTIDWNGIKGHFDFIVHDGDQDFIIEAKTMSGNYARQFRQNPNDDRGYLTQLSLYSAARDLPAAWLCLDKSNQEMFAIPLAEDVKRKALQRALNVKERLDRVETIEDVFRYFVAPPGREEIYQRQPTGKKLVPSSLAWSPYKSVVYILTDDFNGYGKPTKYIDRQATAEHAKEELEFLVSTGALIYNG